MNELFDKLIIRVAFTVYLCILLIVYKYAHSLLYPSTRQQMFKKFYPSKNGPQSLHFFGRILGIGIIFSSIQFDISHGLFSSFFENLIIGFVAFSFYLGSIYIMESIILFNFDFSDEVLKRKNLTFGIISFSIAISLAVILKTVLAGSSTSLITMLFMWMFAIVILGFSSKAFKFISKQPFNRLIIQKNISVALSHSGFMFGVALIISRAFEQSANNIQTYSVMVILQILLSVIILPLIRTGIIYVFQLQDEDKSPPEMQDPPWGYGLFEGVVLLTSCLLTSVITGQIEFGTFYPVF